MKKKDKRQNNRFESVFRNNKKVTRRACVALYQFSVVKFKQVGSHYSKAVVMNERWMRTLWAPLGGNQKKEEHENDAEEERMRRKRWMSCVCVCVRERADRIGGFS